MRPDRWWIAWDYKGGRSRIHLQANGYLSEADLIDLISILSSELRGRQQDRLRRKELR